MTPERKAELRALVEATVPGPWEWRRDNDLRTLADRGTYPYGSQVLCLRDDDDELAMAGPGVHDFVEASRTALPEALDDIDRLEARIATLEAELAEARKPKPWEIGSPVNKRCGCGKREPRYAVCAECGGWIS